MACVPAYVCEWHHDVHKVALGIWLEAITESAEPCNLYPRGAACNECHCKQTWLLCGRRFKQVTKFTWSSFLMGGKKKTFPVIFMGDSVLLFGRRVKWDTESHIFFIHCFKRRKQLRRWRPAQRRPKWGCNERRGCTPSSFFNTWFNLCVKLMLSCFSALLIIILFCFLVFLHFSVFVLMFVSFRAVKEHHWIPSCWVLSCLIVLLHPNSSLWVVFLVFFLKKTVKLSLLWNMEVTVWEGSEAGGVV